MSDELASFRQEWAEELFKDDNNENDSTQESASQQNIEEEKVGRKNICEFYEGIF